MSKRKKINKVLYDSDFLISYFLDTEPNYKKAVKIFRQVEAAEVFILNLVEYEIATVLSRLLPHAMAKEIVKVLRNLDVNKIFIDEKRELGIWQEYNSYKKKNISFVDCANLVIARKYKMEIASFDKFYPKNIIVKAK